MRVNLYAGWRTQKGFNLHFDGHDTMILQVHGRKYWKVYRPTRLHPFADDIKMAYVLRTLRVEGVLENGGMLYLPRGWCVRPAADEPSLHLTQARASHRRADARLVSPPN